MSKDKGSRNIKKAPADKSSGKGKAVSAYKSEGKGGISKQSDNEAFVPKPDQKSSKNSKS
jgi:hypothetical protein